jgi:ABC-2 type transport system ATP-binding protein
MTESNVVIEVRALTKRYGHARGVGRSDLRGRPRRGVRVPGPNGAGKTTTIRTLLDFIRPTSGSVRVFGLDPRREGVRVHGRVGYLPASSPSTNGSPARRSCGRWPSSGGRPQHPRARRAARRPPRCGPHQTVHELSHGNKQKIGLVQAFMHDPDLLILDEPTQGLDPLVQQTFYSMVEEERTRGATIFLSSHVMPEVERLCDRVGIIREGHLATVADIGELKAKALRRIEFHFDEPVPASAFEHLPGVKEVIAHGDSVLLSIEGTVDAVVKEAARHGSCRWRRASPASRRRSSRSTTGAT